MSYDPYANLPSAANFHLSSKSFADGAFLPSSQVSRMASPDGADRSPHLRWDGAPEGTRSFVLTCLDPDAPTASGFWHLAAYNIPSSVNELKEGAVSLDSIAESFPREASLLQNDGGVRGFVGAAPPPGHGPHRYMFVLSALDVEHIKLDDLASPAMLGFQMFGHTLGRARLTGLYENR